MKKKPNNEESDEFDADEPEEFEESGSDWDPEDGQEGKKRKVKTNSGGKKPKKKKTENAGSEEEEDEENEDDEEEDLEDDDEETDEDTAAPGGDGANTDASVKAFTNGSFVVLKSDFKTKKDPPLWRIDGRALLQKYIPFEQDGKTVYKNTSTYSGWTRNSQCQYAAAPISFLQQGKKVIIIEFNKDQVQLGEETIEIKTEAPEEINA